MEVIRVENLSKLYDLGQVGTGTLSKDLNRWWANVRGKDDPYARIGQVNDRTKKAGKDETVWALKDINFSVDQGEVVGIIGRNGAGKSTLLKIISRITTPTKGSVKVIGRIASLLEVGTGFHPEMTGRENIFMNGTLLGMTRREIQSKLDEIIDFAGVALYIDTPVKRYSSGMQVRLAFAVAAFLEPEILIVDEVLAVGDAEFQKKAIGRMQEVSRGDGRTILFVSHNLGAVSLLCNSGILFEYGTIKKTGSIPDVLSAYALASNSRQRHQSDIDFKGPLKDYLRFHSYLLNGVNPFNQLILTPPQEELKFEFKGSSSCVNGTRIIFSLYKDSVRIFSVHDLNTYSALKGDFASYFTIPPDLLRPGFYTVALGAHSSKEEWLWSEHIFDFEVTEVFDDNNDRRNFGVLNVQNQIQSGRMAVKD